MQTEPKPTNTQKPTMNWKSPTPPAANPYTAIPQNPPPQNFVVLHYYHPHHNYKPLLRKFLIAISSLLFFLLTIYLLFPTDPTLQLSRLHLNKVKVNASPIPTISLSFFLSIHIRNPDFFSVDYDSLLVSLGYRGRELGFVRSSGGKITARGSSYVNATLDLDGIEVVHDAFFLIEDLVRGVIPFDTVSRVSGDLGFLFLRVPVKGKVACEVFVNANNQTIVRQDCCA